MKAVEDTAEDVQKYSDTITGEFKAEN